MNFSTDPQDVVLRRMIRDAERSYERQEKPKRHRVTMGNDPKSAGIDCTEFQPTEQQKLGNYCYGKYLQSKNEEAKQQYKDVSHCVWKK